MAFSLITIVVGAVVAYLVLMVILHKLFEKFFMMLLFVISTLFVIGVLYFALKGI